MNCKFCGSSGPLKVDRGFKRGHANICKKCHSSRSLKSVKLKLAEKNPELWFKCGDCSEIFNIWKSSGKSYRTKCYYCESENIKTFKELTD